MITRPQRRSEDKRHIHYINYGKEELRTPDRREETGRREELEQGQGERENETAAGLYLHGDEITEPVLVLARHLN
jgi:hypothetical protein